MSSIIYPSIYIYSYSIIIIYYTHTDWSWLIHFHDSWWSFCFWVQILRLQGLNHDSKNSYGYIKFRALRICFWITPGIVFVFLHFGFLVDEKPKKRRKVSCLNQRRPHVVLLLLLSHFWHGSGRSVSAVRSDGKSFHPANGGPKIHRSEHQLESRTGRFWDRKSKFRSTVNSKICIISTIQPFSRDLSSVPWDVWCRNVRSRLCAHGSRDPLDVWIRPRPSLLGSKCPEWNTNSSGPCWVNHPVVGRWSLTLWGSYIFIVRIPY